MPTLRHLQIFVETAKCQKMSTASDNLYLTQSSISQAISELEKYYNAPLFERLNKKLYITEIGKNLYEEAQKVLLCYDNMEARINEMAAKPTLHIGTSGPAVPYYLESLLDSFNSVMPGINVKIFSFSTRFAEEKLLNNFLDIAILDKLPKERSLETIPVIQDELVFVCNRNHPFSTKDCVHPAELNNQFFIQSSDSSTTRYLLSKFISDNGINVESNWQCNNATLALEWVNKGRGIGIVSRKIVESSAMLDRLHIFTIIDQRLVYTLYIAFHKDKYQSKALKTFLDIGKRSSQFSC